MVVLTLGERVRRQAKSIDDDLLIAIIVFLHQRLILRHSDLLVLLIKLEVVELLHAPL